MRRQKSANEMPAAPRAPSPPDTDSWPAAADHSDNDRRAGELSLALRLESDDTARRRRQVLMKTPVKCRRHSALLNLAILSLFIIHNQIETSAGQQLTNRAQQLTANQQQQQQQQQRRPPTQNATLIRAPSPIDQALGRQMQNSSSQKASSSVDSQKFETSRSQQAMNAPLVKDRRQPAALEPIAATTSLGGLFKPETVSPSDALETAESATAAASSADQEEQPADDEADAADSEGDSEQPEEASSTPISRRDDRFASEPPLGFEGIQVRPSRQSLGGPLETANSGRAGPILTTLRTFGQPEMTTGSSVVSSRVPQASNWPTRQPVTSSEAVLTSAGSFDVSFGTDRMMIKPADDHETRLLLSSSPSPLPNNQRLWRQPTPASATTTRAPRHQTNSNVHEMAIESVNHHHHQLPASSIGGLEGRLLSLQTTNKHAGSDYDQAHTSHAQRVGSSHQQQFIGDGRQQHELSLATICYTPLSLLLVILATILITLVVCLGAYFLFRYLKRRQFDLVANSKHFDHKHLSTSSDGYSQGAAGAGTAPLSLGAHSNYLSQGSSLDFGRQQQAAQPPAKGACPVHLLQADERCNKCLGFSEKQAGRTISTTNIASYAFKNPYFTDDRQHHHHNQQAGALSPLGRRSTGERVDLEPSPGRRRDCSPSSSGLLKAASSNEQMHFIESHIADLHNRQVTSSVKELSSLGADAAHLAQQVVDLTSEEQRARVRAHSKEGDLVAVDLTGHDIVGLGFDLCGNQQDGIFIRSVSSLGPARESGCVQAGDRIKCININFENMTIQDACDILNAGSPYKLRLLIEKKIATGSDLKRMEQSDRPVLPPERRQQPTVRLQPGVYQFSAHEPSRGPLEATRAYLKRFADRLLGQEADGWRPSRQQVEEDFRRHNQRMMMATANNPLLMINQQALPNISGDLYKMAPINSLAAAPADPTRAQFASFERANTDSEDEIDGRHPPGRSNEHSNGKVADKTAIGKREARDPSQQHRRAVSCHINGAYQADEFGELGDELKSRHEKGKQSQGKYLSRADASDMVGSSRPHDKLPHNDFGEDDDDDDGDDDLDAHRPEQEDAERLYDYERQSKLMDASGETFNSKSRLTM